MRKYPINAVTRSPGSDKCAEEFAAIFYNHSLQVGFRPIADFLRCEIIGYMTTVRGPAGMVQGSYGRLARIARQLSLLNEFCFDSVTAIVQRFHESKRKGLLFVPLPAGAIEAIGHPLADSIHEAVANLGHLPESTVLIIPAIAPEKFSVAREFAARLLETGFQLASSSFGCALTERELWSKLPVNFTLLEEHF
ncbi:hypothetical protein, partial [Propionivibrio sp.]|uniref:hypothetical protein n=1 Tax=Propionivibrio sp. TaxID=2212460 RepID=UPI003BF3C590